jgi:hypothetical protein
MIAAMDNAPLRSDADDYDIPDIPWWAWIASAALMAVCYAASGGRGIIAFIAAAGLCRFLVAPRLTRESTAGSAAAVILAVGGFVIFLVLWIVLDHLLGVNSFQG